MTLPFPSLNMSLISKAMMKLSNGLAVLSREDPVSAHTITRSKAHREEAKAKGGNTDDEINRFTHGPEDIPQSSSQAPARAPDCLDHLLNRVEQMHSLLSEHITYSRSQFVYLQGQINSLSSQIQDLKLSDSNSDAF